MLFCKEQEYNIKGKTSPISMYSLTPKKVIIDTRDELSVLIIWYKIPEPPSLIEDNSFENEVMNLNNISNISINYII